MKLLALVTPLYNYGPFLNIFKGEDRWICDGCELQINIIGEAIIEDYVVPPPLPRDPLEIQQEIIKAVQLRLDTFAQSRNYDSILSASTYATSAILKFQTEGQAAVNARDSTWATLYTILAEVQGGTRPMPTGYVDIEPDLPQLTWPE